jgi:hypothetical protein
VQAFAGLLIKSKGRVVNVSSVGAVVNTPWIGRPLAIPIYPSIFKKDEVTSPD